MFDGLLDIHCCCFGDSCCAPPSILSTLTCCDSFLFHRWLAAVCLLRNIQLLLQLRHDQVWVEAQHLCHDRRRLWLHAAIREEQCLPQTRILICQPSIQTQSVDEERKDEIRQQTTLRKLICLQPSRHQGRENRPNILWYTVQSGQP